MGNPTQKEIAFFECIECENCCSYGINNYKKDSRYYPRVPKGCPIGKKSKWRRSQDNLNTNKWNIKYFCESCVFLCICSPTEKFPERTMICPMYAKFHENRVYRFTAILNRLKQNKYATEKDIADWERLLKNEKKPAIFDPQPKWFKK
jgi:hypothetical protein